MRLPLLQILFLFLFCSGNKCFGQTCPCLKIFDSLSNHLKINYPGYEFGRENSDWETWYLQSRKEVNNENDPKKCTEKLSEFLSIFKDGHLGIRHTGSIFEREKNKPGIPAWPDVSENLARNYLDSRISSDSLEGIWESYEGLYKVFIKKEDGERYTGFLLETVNQNWQKGEVKMIFEPSGKGKLKLKYFMSAHETKSPAFILNRNILEIKNRIVFQKIYPKVEHPIPFESFVSESFGLSEDFIQWNSETFYIQLQNISAGNKPLIDSLIRKNDHSIRKAKYLILDLRDNGGGDFTCFDNLWPYILTGPAVVFGTTYHCTPSNILAYKKQIAELESEILVDFQDLAIEMEKHIGEDWQIPNDTLTVENTLELPQKVILLVNGKCKSSVENFVLTAMQSKKVVVAGERTGGVADYEELVDFPICSKDYILQMPIGRTNRLPANPLDGIGIVPAIQLKSKNRAWQPWVKEVLKRVN